VEEQNRQGGMPRRTRLRRKEDSIGRHRREKGLNAFGLVPVT